MSRLVLQAAVLAAALVAAEGSSCWSTETDTNGCSCFYMNNWARVSCPTLFALHDLPPLTRTLYVFKSDVSSLAGDLFASLAMLEELLLSWNRMSSVSEHAFRNLTNLRVLDLSHNLLSSLPPHLFDGMSRLQKLDLSFNRFTALDADTFRCVPNLDDLSLAYNDHLGAFIESSPEAMSVVFRNDLRMLSLDHIDLEYLPESFFVEAESLRELSLADNPLQMIPFLPGGLETLDLSGSLFQRLIPGSFVTLPFLRVLRLQRLGELVEVQENAFEGLVSLEELWMQGCEKLAVVSAGAFGELDLQRCTVRRLSLAWGGLAELPENLLGPLSKLESLDLQNNPWECDCHIAWLRRLNLSSRQTADLRCASPPELSNSLLLSLPESAFRCSDRRWRGVVLVAAGAALLLLLAVGGARLWRRLSRLRRPDGGRAPGAYEMLHMDGPAADDDEDAVTVWSTESSARQPPSGTLQRS